MICPHCGEKLKVVDSRPDGGNTRFRKYVCPKCGFEEVTEERLPAKEA